MKATERGIGVAASGRLAGAVLLASALVLALGGGNAAAHKQTHASNVQLKPDAISDTAIQLSGKVTSENARCIAGRTVSITANGIEIASATTLVNGDYLVQTTPRPAKGTTLIASVQRKFLKRSKRHRHKCASDFSERKAP